MMLLLQLCQPNTKTNVYQFKLYDGYQLIGLEDYVSRQKKIMEIA